MGLGTFVVQITLWFLEPFERRVQKLNLKKALICENFQLNYNQKEKKDRGCMKFLPAITMAIKQKKANKHFIVIDQSI